MRFENDFTVLILQRKFQVLQTLFPTIYFKTNITYNKKNLLENILDSSSSSSSSEDEWEKEHKSTPRYKRGGKWVRTSGDDTPPRAMQAGFDHGGTPLYVGRAHHEGDLIPWKVNPEHNCCYVPWGGEEHAKEEY